MEGEAQRRAENQRSRDGEEKKKKRQKDKDILYSPARSGRERWERKGPAFRRGAHGGLCVCVKGCLDGLAAIVERVCSSGEGV